MRNKIVEKVPKILRIHYPWMLFIWRYNSVLDKRRKKYYVNHGIMPWFENELYNVRIV